MKVPTAQYTYIGSKSREIAFIQKCGHGFAVKYNENVFVGDTIPDAFRSANISSISEEMWKPNVILCCMKYLMPGDPRSYMEEFVKG